jgi:hypothetical protein
VFGSDLSGELHCDVEQSVCEPWSALEIEEAESPVFCVTDEQISCQTSFLKDGQLRSSERVDAAKRWGSSTVENDPAASAVKDQDYVEATLVEDGEDEWIVVDLDGERAEERSGIELAAIGPRTNAKDSVDRGLIWTGRQGSGRDDSRERPVSSWSSAFSLGNQRWEESEERESRRSYSSPRNTRGVEAVSPSRRSRSGGHDLNGRVRRRRIPRHNMLRAGPMRTSSLLLRQPRTPDM